MREELRRHVAVAARTMDEWSTLLALLPASSHSTFGRKLEATQGTVAFVRSQVTHEAFARCITRSQQYEMSKRYSKPKVRTAQAQLSAFGTSPDSVRSQAMRPRARGGVQSSISHVHACPWGEHVRGGVRAEGLGRG